MPPNSNCPIKVSVIVPVYNVEKYLRTCMDFIVAQTLKEIEIICVNDGSTDGSLAILEEYALDDSRIKIVTQENKGLSGARNTGMDLAKGEYIAFIDSDDWFYTLTALEELYERAKKFSLDVLRHRLVCFDNLKYSFFHSPWDNYAKFLPKGFQMEAFPPEACVPFFWRIPVTVPAAIYRRDYVEKNNLRFADGLMYEDQLFFRQCLLTAKRLGFLDKALVVYRKNRVGSITDESSNWSHYIVAQRMIVEFAKKVNASHALLDSFRCSFIEKVSWMYQTQKDIEWKENVASVLRDVLPVIIPSFLCADKSFLQKISYRSQLFLSWVYSNLSYSEFSQQRAKKLLRYKLLSMITLGKRRKHYKEKLVQF